ncbi:MAG: amino acid permease, partial [Dehalococcoidia bacterium]|nr:amino acid permease [Dehalococcoidia bacterium]
MAFGTRLGFVAGWLMLTINVRGAGAVSLGFAGYLNHLTGMPGWPGSGLLLAVSTAVALLGTSPLVRLAGGVTVAEAARLISIGIVGAPSMPGANLTTMPNGFAGVTAAAALVFFPYIGFGQVGNLAEEMCDPKRDLPRSDVSLGGDTGLIYVSTALAAAAVVEWEALSLSEAPLALVAVV